MIAEHKHLLSLVLFVCLLSFSGCTSLLHTVDIPTLEMGSPLRGVKPKTFVFKEFKDIRGGEDKNLIFMMGKNDCRLDQPPASLTAHRLEKEFQRNGHLTIVDKPQAKSDFIVEGTIYKFTAHDNPAFFGSTQNGYTGVKLTITGVSTNVNVFVKSYEGEHSIKSDTPRSGWKIALTQAFLSMIKEISTDPELIQFIKK